MTSKFIRQGFDWLAVSFQGRPGGALWERLLKAKEEACEAGEGVLIKIGGFEGVVCEKGTGGKTGYSVVVDFGPDRFVLLLRNDGHLIDDPSSGHGWNIRLEARAAFLATAGIEAVIAEWRRLLSEWGIIYTNESVSRVDYCIDVVDNDFQLNMENIIMPPKMRGCDYFEDGDNSINYSSFNGRRRTSVRCGSIENYQAVVYDKTLEVKSGKAGTEHWRVIWGDDVGEKDRVWRVEFRAAGKLLKKHGVRTLSELVDNAKKIFERISRRVRIVQGSDLNISRRGNCTLWGIVQRAIDNLCCHGDAYDEPVDIRLVQRERAIGVISSMLIGLSATYQSLTGEVCKKVSRDAIFALLERFQNENGQDYSRKVARAHRRYVFIT